MEYLQPIVFLKIVSLVFLGILFMQSGLDKIINYGSNYEWLKSHFSKSPLRNTVDIFLPIITTIETGAGILCTLGLIFFLANGSLQLAMFGAQLSCLAILMLFFGQRMVQDYEGASTLVGYFVLCMATIFILQL